MKLRKIKTKKAALELSIGTVVIIVLALTMLILGLILIRSIFSSAGGAIDAIDQGVKDEINRLFSENRERVLVLFPDTGIIELERGSRNKGFAISLRNPDDGDTHVFSYTVTPASQIDCGTHPVTAGSVTILGQSETGISLGPAKALENPRHVRLSVDESAPLCTFSLKVDVQAAGCSSCTSTAFMDVEITP